MTNSDLEKAKIYVPFSGDYIERVYAGVLGKMIGVYLGRPIEGWSYEKIRARFGEITYYVHEQLGLPLVVADDDLSGTFTFLRALADHGYRPDLTAEQIGQTWLNYIVENRAILWWGGLGHSTEHTAYLRLKRGIPAPRSGSSSLNGKIVSEQIGAQIFIDGWAMVSPGNPTQAAELARKAASVSHDGEAIYGAQVVAAMEAQAFVEQDTQRLLDVGISFIPRDSVIYRLIQDLREWHQIEPNWRNARERLVAKYGYDLYGGNCHIVPNHALVMLALLYGEDDFQQSLMIVNASGWDTDCNSGNLGCLLGIKNGLASIERGPDWRGPVADRLYLPTADGGRCITDAVTETYHIVNTARLLAGGEAFAPKGGARFHFELPGSVQGFQLQTHQLFAGAATVENVAGFSQEGGRSLALRYTLPEPGQTVCMASPTFLPATDIKAPGYTLLASPTLYAGQTVRGVLTADPTNATPILYQLCLACYGEDEQLTLVRRPAQTLLPGQREAFTWLVPDTAGMPIATIGIALRNEETTQGSIYLDFLTWDGAPDLTLTTPQVESKYWRHAWVDALDHFESRWPEPPIRLIQNEGRGFISQGTRQWTNYRLSATITPHMAQGAGIGARVQGLRRYYALLIAQDHTARLVKVLHGEEQILASAPLEWLLDRPYELGLEVDGRHIQAWIDGTCYFDIQDEREPFLDGGIALICEEGRVESHAVRVRPV